MAKPASGIKGFFKVAVLLALLESALMLLGFLPTLLSYSLLGILFTSALYAVIAYMGWTNAEDGLKKVALDGAAVSFAANLVLCAATFAYLLPNPPHLDAASLTWVLAVILAFNVLIGAGIAVLGALLARKKE
jgi:hypothetical protein